MKGFFVAVYIFCSSFFRGHVNFQKEFHPENRKPTPVVTPRPTHTPKPTRSPKPTFTPSPTATPSPKAEISNVVVHACTTGSSCYDYITGVEVNGKNFAEDSRTKLLNGSTQYSGTLMGLTQTQIITDFMNLPHCKTFDVVVYGSTGTATASGSVNSICP